MRREYDDHSQFSTDERQIHPVDRAGDRRFESYSNDQATA
jgi:hypothetical protein